MKKIWEFLQENQEKIRYQQTEYFSPYYEVSKESIRKENKTYQVNFNSFYRYEEVFEYLFDLDINPKYQQLLFDCIMHYLISEEFRLGITKEEYYIRNYWKNIQRGIYGKNVQNVFGTLSKEKKHLIAATLYKQSKVNPSVYLFATALTSVMDNCVVYRNKIVPMEILVYIKGMGTRDAKSTVMAVKELFLPLKYTLRIFNGQHFGVIQADQTLEIDQIEIF